MEGCDYKIRVLKQLLRIEFTSNLEVRRMLLREGNNGVIIRNISELGI